MKTALITIKTKPELKQEAQKIADNLGFSLSSIINGYLVGFVKNKTIHFTDNSEEPSDYLIQILKDAEQERKKGDYHSFKNSDEAVSFLDSIIDKKA